jgi:HAD superfamily hydrolase (TIGR01509 family)
LNLVFDFAGVLFHWRPAALLARLLPQRRITPDEFFQGYAGDWGEFDRGAIDAGPLAMRIAMRTAITPAEALRVIDAVPVELQPDADMVALLGELDARDSPLYYLSNMPAPYARALEDRHEFLGWFRHGVYSGRVGLAKPDPAIFAHAETAFGLDPATTLYFDDVQANVAAAQDRGWDAVRWESAGQCRAELVARGLL